MAKLYNDHKIHFVTAREKALEMITLAYLSQKQIPYDSLHVTGSTNKVDNAVALQCDVYLEIRLMVGVQQAIS